MSTVPADHDDIDGDSWWLAAACQGMDTTIFFPAEPDRVPLEAQIVCDGCPVHEPCRQHALRHELYGVWAATSEDARWRLRRALRIHVDRPEVADPPREQVCSMHDRGLLPREIAGEIGVSRRTVHRYLAEGRENH